MAAKLGVNLPFPLVQADWETLIRGIESKVQAMKDLKKGEEKDEMLNFYPTPVCRFATLKTDRAFGFSTRENYTMNRALLACFSTLGTFLKLFLRR